MSDLELARSSAQALADQWALEGYLSGPMRGYPKYNFPAFDEAQAVLESKGWTIDSPAAMDREIGFDPEVNETFDGFNLHEALSRDFAAIARRRAIIFLPGWEKSQGAAAEKIVGEMLGKKLFLYDPQAPRGVRPFEERDRDHKEIITNPITGGQKETRLARFDLVPAKPLWEVAELYGRGAQKYSDRNWERGYVWSLSYGALLRHATLFWMGESRDSETGAHHLASVVFHALALMQFEERNPDLDDRPKS